MANLEPKIETNSKLDRRKIIQAALGSAPLIATLTSRPVHAVQGLSNMLSGDASVCRGDNFYGGMSPGFWKTPNGRTDAPYSDACQDAWKIAGCLYGKLKKGEQGNQFSDYRGGTRYSDVFGSNIYRPNRPLRKVLNQDSGTDQFHLIAGLLNARYFGAKAGFGSSSEYMFTEAQFWAMYNGTMQVPDAYNSLRDLIESNYHGVPGDACGSWSSKDEYN
jgi:hypothetical protein